VLHPDFCRCQWASSYGTQFCDCHYLPLATDKLADTMFIHISKFCKLRNMYTALGADVPPYRQFIADIPQLFAGIWCVGHHCVVMKTHSSRRAKCRIGLPIPSPRNLTVPQTPVASSDVPAWLQSPGSIRCISQSARSCGWLPALRFRRE
jgi:hypothetical protein